MDIDGLEPALHEIVVVVPAHNERDRLPTCLASVRAAADRVDVPVRVMVVLDSCTDGTEDAVTGSVSALSIQARNVGAARAAGFAATSAADPAVWLATTDADCVVPTDWLAGQIAHHGRSVHAAVGTVLVDWREHSLATRGRYDRLYRVSGTTHGHVHGANLGVRADAYWAVGGFRGLRVGEDVDLVQRLVAAEASVEWDVGNAVLTSDRREVRAQGGFGDFVSALADVDDASTEATVA
jgi:glycosyltransferase involved in cell wall biosynthesis